MVAIPDYPRLPIKYTFDANRVETVTLSPTSTSGEKERGRSTDPSLRLSSSSSSFATTTRIDGDPLTDFNANAASADDILRAALALTLTLHAGDDGFAFKVEDGDGTAGLVSGVVDRAKGTIADLLQQVEQTKKLDQQSEARLELVYDQDGDSGTSRTPLKLRIDCSADGRVEQLHLDHDTQLVPELEARWFVQHVHHIFTQLVLADLSAKTKISELSVLPSSEEVVLAEYSTSAPSLSYEIYPSTIKTLHGFVEYTASTDPTLPALQFDDLVLTYSQLLHGARYLASTSILPRLEFSRGKRVIPVCLDKTPEMIISMLAILLSGAAYLNLEPNWPDQRKQTILAELREVGSLADISIIKSGDGEKDKWKNWGNHVVDPEEVLRELLKDHEQMEKRFPASPEIKWPEVKEKDLAYVIYTSGTTGVPKGIAVEHRNVAAFLRNYRGIFGRAKGERVLQFPSYSFDVSIMNIWDTFAHGATLCMTSPSSLMSDLAGTILRLNCTLVDLTPTISALLFEHLESQPKNGESVREAWTRAGFKIKQVNTGGEKVEAWIRDAWMDRGVRVVIDYGPTETTVGVIANRSTARSPPNVPIGRPVGATRVFILSSDTLVTLPLGCIGEICIGGEQVTRGYIRQSLNEDVFVDVKGIGRIYRTGDLGRFLGDGQGSIDCLGRKDGQVKVNGLRIETGEIEEHLTPKAHPAIRRGVVDKLETGDIAPSLVAFIDLSSEEFPTSEDDRSADADLTIMSCSTMSEFTDLVEQAKQHLAKSVPAYMVPRYWLPVNRIPTQGMGKTDRKSLRLLAERHDWKKARKVGAGSKEVREAAKVFTDDKWYDAAREAWSTVLKMESSDIADGDVFTQLGGDSIGFLKVVSKLRQAGYKISFRELVDCATLADCARVLVQASAEDINGGQEAAARYTEFSLLPSGVTKNEVLQEIASELDIASAEIEDVLPTAPSQDALLAASIDSTHYYAQAIYSLAEDVELSAVANALAKLVEINAVLRTCFAVLESTGSTMQIVLRNGSEQVRKGVAVEQIEVEDREMDKRIDAWLDGDRSEHVFKWGRLALSFAIFSNNSSSSKRKLAWSMHHAMSDGWTLELLSADLRALVHGLHVGPRPSFSAFVDWWSKTPNDSHRLEAFWKSYLSEAKPLNWPSQAPLKGEQLSTSLAAALHWHGDLKSLSKNSGITPAIASRVAVALALSHASGRADVVLGIVRSGRDIEVEQAEETIGPCVSVLPSRIFAKPTSSLLDLAKQESSDDRQARANQHVTLSSLAKICNLSARADLFDILVTYQSLAERDAEDATRSKLSWPIRQPPEKIRMPTSYTLSMEMTPQIDDPEALELACFYDERLIEESMVMEILRSTAKVLDYFVTAPCTKIAQLKLEGSAKSETAVNGSNGDAGDPAEKEVEDDGALEPVMGKITIAWSSVLRMDPDEIGPIDSFASLGGDSITMMRLSVRLRKEGVPIPVQTLTKLATIREQARWCLSKQRSSQ